MTRIFMCTFEEPYDFDTYFAKMEDCLAKAPVQLDRVINFPLGIWISYVGASKSGAQQRFIESLIRTVEHFSHCQKDIIAGVDDLCRGEFLFYQGDIQAAEIHIALALESLRMNGRFEYIHRALFYTMRIAIMQGNRIKAEQAIKDIKNLLSEESYPTRFSNYDIAVSWYYCCLQRPEMVSGWLKEEFTPYIHANYVENFGNQVKARYHYLQKDYQGLLAYIEEMKQRESILYGKVEMLVLEACALYRMKDRKGAFAALRAAYEAAFPDSVIMPFIESGKDMRTLTAAALSVPDCGIPDQWLKNINQKASYYAKYKALIIADYERENDGNIPLSQRESEILSDIYNGLTRSEISNKHGLSVSMVKLMTGNINQKLSANNTVDLIRIAKEQKLL